MKRLLPLLLLALAAVSAFGQPAITYEVYPRYITATPSSSTLENPVAFLVRISGLQPSTAYSQLHMGFNLSAAPTSTRGSKWVPGSGGWISPSTAAPWRTSDASGVIRAWIPLRTPSSFDNVTYSDSSRITVRVSRFGIDTARFDGPFNIYSLDYRTSPTGARPGAIVYGYVDSLNQLPGNLISVYRNASDTEPMSTYFIFPRAPLSGLDLYRTRTDTSLRRAGYFQLMIPANTPVAKLEVRDTLTGAVIRTQTSTLWRSGAAGTMTNLNLQDPIVMSVEEREGAVPAEFALSQNYPNPFNPATRIDFSVPYEADVTLAVYDVLGRLVTTLAGGRMEAGLKTAVWDGTNAAGAGVPSGVYFLRMTAGSFAATRSMVLLK